MSLIEDRLDSIEKMSNGELIQQIGNSYRSHYRTQCVCISWNHPLQHLQLIGICFGGKSLSCVLRYIAMNYRHAISGMPDLLMIRVRRLIPLSNSQSNISDADIIPEYIYENVDISTFLGESWNTKDMSTMNLGKVDQNDGNLAASGDNSDEVHLPDVEELNDVSNILLNDESVDFHSPNTHTISFDERDETSRMESNVECHNEKDSNSGIDDVSTSPSMLPLQGKTYVDKFHCGEKDIEIFSLGNVQKVDGGGENVNSYYLFESMLVEVKGPNDTLSDKQIMWLYKLQQAGIKGFVGRVKESKLA